MRCVSSYDETSQKHVAMRKTNQRCTLHTSFSIINNEISFNSGSTMYAQINYVSRAFCSLSIECNVQFATICRAIWLKYMYTWIQLKKRYRVHKTYTHTYTWISPNTYTTQHITSHRPFISSIKSFCLHLSTCSLILKKVKQFDALYSFSCLYTNLRLYIWYNVHCVVWYNVLKSNYKGVGNCMISLNWLIS